MSIQENIHQISASIHEAERLFNRSPNSVLLLAVSKTQPPEAIRLAYEAGLRDFGENYLQEALPKIEALKDNDIHWHFIGPVQSNKARDIAHHFSWVHSLDRLKVAKKLSEAREKSDTPLNVCLQINLDTETSKSGLLPEEIPEIIPKILELPDIRLRGLMAIPMPREQEKAQYECFLRLNHLLQSLNKRFDIKMDTLSMGMSNDYIAAIKAGSTIIRVGQAIFGKRL